MANGNGENGKPKKSIIKWVLEYLPLATVVFFCGVFYNTVNANHQEFLTSEVNNEKCHQEIKSDIKDMINKWNISVDNSTASINDLRTQVAVLVQKIDDMRRENRNHNHN